VCGAVGPGGDVVVVVVVGVLGHWRSGVPLELGLVYERKAQTS